MFRKMRRVDRELSRKEAEDILRKATHGTLALEGADGYPYAVPVSYAYKDDKIVFHSALEGQKIESLRKYPKVSMAVTDADDIVAEKFTTHFRSAIAFGIAEIVEEGEELYWAMRALLEKYSPHHMEGGEKYMKSALGKYCAVIVSVKYLTGKAST